jgi:hypothetical protein
MWMVLLFIGGVGLAGVGIFLAAAGLDEADKWASVFGIFATLVGLGLSAYGLVLARRPQTARPAGQTVMNSTVGGEVTQVRGVHGSLRIGAAAAAPPSPPPSFPPRSVPSDGPASSGGQSVTGTWTAGPVRQVDDIGGDADIDR